MTPESFDRFARQCRSDVESYLAAHLPSEQHLPYRLHSAMRYSAMAPGKRVRPLLVYAAGRAIQADVARLHAAAAAVELIHSFSLVHDDLPAMDDDDLRRGRPTCHKAFDEATAILAGDALQTFAFQLLAQDASGLSAQARLGMVRELAVASGSLGMAGGQMLDMEAEGRSLTLPELENLHIHKTGALIRACVRMACLAVEGLHESVAQRLDHYAKCVGLAFQIRDDVLDVESDTATLGKTQGKDQLQEKATYPLLIGLEGSREKAVWLVDEALASLEPFGNDADALRQLARYIVGRTN